LKTAREAKTIPLPREHFLWVSVIKVANERSFTAHKGIWDK